MIRIENVSFDYEHTASAAALKQICSEIRKGQVVLLCGESGSGKTTFSRLINGLVPAFYEGELKGRVTIKGKDTQATELYELAPLVGSVFQNPKSQFYTLQTDTEVVFACENIGLKREDILSRFDVTIESMHMENLLGRSLFALSGGEKQKIACASVGVLQPDILVLDEPTSNLDIGTIQDLRSILLSWKAQGKTIVVAEHRLAWLCGIVDRVLLFEDGRITEDVNAEVFWQKPHAELQAKGLRAPMPFVPRHTFSEEVEADGRKDVLELEDFSCELKKVRVLDIPFLSIPRGAVVAVLGNNGAGKTTFARCLCGLVKKAKGTLTYKGTKYSNKERAGLCSLVMQDVSHQLFAESVYDEVILGATIPEGSSKETVVDEILASLDLLDYKSSHPLSLSGGQRQRVALAGAIASHKEILIYDEPTSGLDYRHMKDVAKCIRMLAAMGKTQFVVTHDPEIVSLCCDHYIFLHAGEIIQSGTWTPDSIEFVSAYFGRV